MKESEKPKTKKSTWVILIAVSVYCLGSAAIGMYSSFIPSDKAHLWGYKVLPVSVIFFLYLYSFVGRATNGKLIFFNAIEVTKGFPIYKRMLYFLIPFGVAFGVWGFLHTQLNIYGSLLASEEKQAVWRYEGYEKGATRGTRNLYGVDLVLDDGTRDRLWVTGSQLRVNRYATLENASHARVGYRVGPLGKIVDKISLLKREWTPEETSQLETRSKSYLRSKQKKKKDDLEQDSEVGFNLKSWSPVSESDYDFDINNKN